MESISGQRVEKKTEKEQRARSFSDRKFFGGKAKSSVIDLTQMGEGGETDLQP